MKAVCFITIMLFVLFTVGSASAEDQTATLTEDNSNVNRDDAGTLPHGIINVKVTYNPATGTITYTDSSPTSSSGGPYLVNPRIDQVAYNLPMAGTVGYADWKAAKENNMQMDGFGVFTHKYVESPDTNRYRTVNVQLVGPAPYPSFSPTRNVVAVHLAFEGAYYANGTQIPEAGKGTSLGSTFLAGEINQVPEFPTMALPVAAVLGLLFISQRRKEN